MYPRYGSPSVLLHISFAIAFVNIVAASWPQHRLLNMKG